MWARKYLTYLVKMVPGGGIEPPTRGFSIHRQHLESMTCVTLSNLVSNLGVSGQALM